MTTLNTFFSNLSQKTKYGEPLKIWVYDYEGITPIRTISYDAVALTTQAQIDALKNFVLDLTRGSHDAGFYGLYVTIYGTNPQRLLGQLWFSETQVPT